ARVAQFEGGAGARGRHVDQRRAVQGRAVISGGQLEVLAAVDAGVFRLGGGALGPVLGFGLVDADVGLRQLEGRSAGQASGGGGRWGWGPVTWGWAGRPWTWRAAWAWPAVSAARPWRPRRRGRSPRSRGRRGCRCACRPRPCPPGGYRCRRGCGRPRRRWGRR